jgi:primase-polymerase (primpol)-like protein
MVAQQSYSSSIPAQSELQARKQWVCWCYETDKNGRLTKVPYQARTGYRASSTNPKHWASYEEAIKAQATRRTKDGKAFDGIGFVFNDDYVGTDLDHCINADGVIDEWAQEIINRYNCYCEYSPSKHGIHIFVRGLLPEVTNDKGEISRPGKKVILKGKRDAKAAIEMYCQGRFFTWTESHVLGTPLTIDDRQIEIDAIYQQLQQESEKAPRRLERLQPQVVGPDHLSDEELIQKAMNAKNGMRFIDLWNGDTSAYSNDESSADLSLCNLLAFWTGKDAGRMDRLFRRSGLYREDKWDRNARSGETYSEGTIARAIVSCRETYTGERAQKAEVPISITAIGENGLPDIFVGRLLPEMTDDALAALVRAQQKNPTIFVQSGRLKRISRDESKRPLLQTIGEAELTGALARSANYYRLKKEKDGYAQVPITPPRDVVKDILSFKSEEWPFPPLAGVIQAPMMRPNGTILDTPGYDHETCLYYMPQDANQFSAIADQPTPDEVTKAVAFVQGFIQDFPFEQESDRANALGALLTIVTRQMFRLVPLGVITANKQGTGKGLLNDLLSIVATGEVTDAIAEIENNEEWNKTLTALLMEGANFITVDNVEGVLRSPVLAKVLTSEFHKGRILGLSETVRVPQKAIWIVNGNNVQLGGDLPRRAYMIRMTTQTSTPWERSEQEFKYPDLIAAAKTYRGEIVAALLTIARAWINANKPEAKDIKNMATFTAWAKTIGGMLQHAGIPDFLKNKAYGSGEVDVDGTAWARFLETWQKELGHGDFKTAQIAEALGKSPSFAETLPEPLSTLFLKEDKSFKNKLGRQLAKKNNTPFGPNNLRIVQGEDSHSKVATFKVAGYAGYAGTILSLCEDEIFEGSTKNETQFEVESESGNEANFTPHTPHTPQDSPLVEEENDTLTCATHFDMMLCEEHQADNTEGNFDNQGNWWCVNCQAQHAFMQLGDERGYPEVKNGKRVVVKAGQDQWLTHASKMGHHQVAQALELLGSKGE